ERVEQAPLERHVRQRQLLAVALHRAAERRVVHRRARQRRVLVAGQERAGDHRRGVGLLGLVVALDRVAELAVGVARVLLGLRRLSLGALLRVLATEGAAAAAGG